MNVRIPNQKPVLDFYGVEIQSMVHMEECGELIQAISKMRRANRKNPGCIPDSKRQHLIEEMGDVLICMEQLKLMYGIRDSEIQAMVKEQCEKRKEKMKS